MPKQYIDKESASFPSIAHLKHTASRSITNSSMDPAENMVINLAFCISERSLRDLKLAFKKFSSALGEYSLIQGYSVLWATNCTEFRNLRPCLPWEKAAFFNS